MSKKKQSAQSAFTVWFEEQFGKPPKGDYCKIKEELAFAHEKWMQLAALATEHERYAANKKAALYAWNAGRDMK